MSNHYLNGHLKMFNPLKKYWKGLAWFCFPFFYFFNYKLEDFEIFFKVFDKVIMFSIVMISIIMLSNIRNLKSYSISIIFYFVSCVFTLYIFIKLISFIIVIYIGIENLHKSITYDFILSLFLIIFTLAIALHNNKIIDLSIKDNVYTYINSDQYRTSVHEAGHLICYGLFKKIPSINVKVIDTKNCFFIREYLGYVEVSDDIVSVKTKSFLEWEMKMLLAGKELENYILGDSGSGSKGDFNKWNKIAHEYLELGFGEIYYDKPKDDNERKLNHITLSNLKRKQERELYIFFQYNDKEIKNIVDILYKEKKLNNNQVRKILDNKIKETDDIKKIE